MRHRRNVITLSDMEPELEEWARKEAKRAKKPFYQVVNESLKLLRFVIREYREVREPQSNGEGAAGRDSQ